MTSSSRKRPYSLDLDDDDNQDATNGTQSSGSSRSSRSQFGNSVPAKGQMSLFSFGFVTTPGKKRRASTSSPPDSPRSTSREHVESQQAAGQQHSPSPSSKQQQQQQQQQQPQSPKQQQYQTPPKQRPTPLRSSPKTPSESSQNGPKSQSNSSPLSRPASQIKTPLKQSQPTENLCYDTTTSDQQGVGNHAHLKYSFLQPKNRRDIDMRPPDHPDYDEKTLYVPPQFLKNETPAMRQWWSIKQRNMDAVLFFKMGKFYELFNEDAVIGVNELDLNFMKVSDDKRPAHAGFPESAYQKYAKKLIQKGFKVMRIEQTETPAMLEERAQTTGIKCADKVVRREICQVTTKGTQMLGISETVFYSAQNQYLLALVESTDEQHTSSSKGSKLFGVCFLDVTIGKLYLGQFKDDNNLSNLNILLAHHTPTEIIYERNNLTSDAYKTLLKTGARLVALRAVKEFWPLKKALSHLKVNRIFSGPSGNIEWPKELACLFQEGDTSDEILALEPRDEHKFALNSFGAIVYYLQSQLIAKQVLACASIEIYTSPLGHRSSATQVPTVTSSASSKPPMIMDHVALKNLEIFVDSAGNASPTLFSSLNYCQTHFGQRLLKNWICSPLCDLVQIKNRQDAVESLMSNSNASLMNEIEFMLKKTPDLERMLSKIKSHCFKSEGDTRAVMFDGNQYNKAKVSAFVNLLTNFRRIRTFINSVTKSAQDCDSHVFRRLLSTTANNGIFPDYEEKLVYFENAFDHDKALKTGQIIPAKGINAEYDRCDQNIEELKSQLDNYLEEQKSALNCRQLEYFGSARNRYQLQVPEAYVRKVPDDWRIESGRKGFKRYYTPIIDRYFAKLTCYEEEMKVILDSILARIFEQFLRDAKLWSAAIECVATLDVLQSMARFGRSLKAKGVELCRPNLIESSEEPYVEYVEGRHPVLVSLDANFIPNDLKLDSKLLLLSGANMGGKSTLMRQTALLVILAQLGCCVPAASMSLVPVDRIFSRLGASDRLLEGESTFYTELVETSAMLRCATKDSLLLLDELGRGTSTFDGTAIAYSVLKEISSNLKCRCLFSTHYHTLTRDFMNLNEVRLAHMACKIERENDDNDIDLDPLKENITFLYKIADGPAARSYGYNVAKLAGIQNELITDAFKKSKEIELGCKVLAAMQNVCKSKNLSGPSEALKNHVLALLTA